ncbi:MAG: cation transporter [Calditrichaeota bacterium]|nr:MAG: cation transporter [Calditrichota bacterium]
MKFLERKANLLYISIGGAFLTMILKSAGYFITGSVGVYSDAAESIINLVASLFALFALTIASRPPDKSHTFGHEKAEYFSSGAEGALIIFAAIGIFYSASHRLLHPRTLVHIDTGLLMVAIAALVNLGIALFLLRAARSFDSITLEADARHLLADVYTSGAVIAGLLMVKFTGWQILDTALGYLIGANIIRTGANLMRRSIRGLMDYRLPKAELGLIEEVLNKYQGQTLGYHNLRTRKAGSKRFVEFHLLLPGKISVQKAHDLCVKIEKEIEARLDHCEIIIHVEPFEDSLSWDVKQEAEGKVFVHQNDAAHLTKNLKEES